MSFIHYWQVICSSAPFRCLSHVVNLSNVAVMGHIMKIATIETTTAIWEYNPNLPNNCMLGGNLDVITAVCTIAINVCWVHLGDLAFKNWLPLDSGFWSVNWILQETTNSMQDYHSPQNPTSQQCLLGVHLLYAWPVTPPTPSKSFSPHLQDHSH